MGEKSGGAQRTLFGHPLGLYVLFLTQMGERFSYFGMLALLILYLNSFFKLPQDTASKVFKGYTSLIYFTPLIGGFLADRFLGNKRAVVIGAALMAVGHFLMAFPTLGVLMCALVVLVVGCGLLTPPLTTQVGLLYAPGDARRDSAYTLFYMGINLGAFLSPLACGWLAENTRGRFHSGFTLAGIAMVAALVVYVVGQRWVVEVDQTPSAPEPEPQPPERSEAITATPPAGTSAASAAQPPLPVSDPLGQAPSIVPGLNEIAPALLAGIGGVLVVPAPLVWLTGITGWETAMFVALTGICFLMFAWVAHGVTGAMRDRILAIFLLLIFSVAYWAGAGQYGNAINLWADQNTDRHLSGIAPPPDIYPEAGDSASGPEEEPASPGSLDWWVNLFRPLPRKQAATEPTWGEWWVGLWNPMPTAWFQSVNPLLILLFAPLFAMLWTWLGRRGLNPSIPAKMGLGLLLMALSFAILLAASYREAQPRSVSFPAGRLPDAVAVNDQGQVCRLTDGKPGEPYDGGRLFFDQATRSLRAVGVFPDLVRDEIVRDTAPAGFVKELEELQKKATELAAGPPGWVAQVQLAEEPPDLDLRYAGLGARTGNKDVSYDPATRTLKTTIVLEDKEIKGLKTAAGDPALRTAFNDLMVKANASRVSSLWLLGFFLLATLGELCLSPVGLSMVSQLAPHRFATMLMGLWLLNYSFGNYLAGEVGERWGSWPPTQYDLVMLLALGGATLVLFVLVRKVTALMHESV